MLSFEGEEPISNFHPRPAKYEVQASAKNGQGTPEFFICIENICDKCPRGACEKKDT
jgi:hypothetical protein